MTKLELSSTPHHSSGSATAAFDEKLGTPESRALQYFAPGGNKFVGDCMPYFEDGVFHLYYLLDENHHKGADGLGGHEWVHTASTDLIHWTPETLAVPLTEEWEGSICTGSVFRDTDTYYAFFATRLRDFTQHLSYATSDDPVAFVKTNAAPLMTAPDGYLAEDFRDPFVFRDETGRFQMLVTSREAASPLYRRGGCILRLSSSNLLDWQTEGTLLLPAGEADEAGVPECPDYFEWNGWYYLLFGANHKTSYVMSREPFGPWIRPTHDDLGAPWMLSVMKTAPYHDDRRIGVGWMGAREGSQDNGALQWGGNAVFRELVQRENGELGVKFVDEMLPSESQFSNLSFQALTDGISLDGDAITASSNLREAVAFLEDVPQNFRLKLRVNPSKNVYAFGLGLRGEGAYQARYDLRFYGRRDIATLKDQSVHHVNRFDKPFDLDIVFNGDIVDVSIDGQTCISNRLYELAGNRIFFHAESGVVEFSDIKLFQLD